MPTLNLSDDDLNLITQALRIAAEQYEHDACTVSGLRVAPAQCGAALTRLSNQFSYQADRARELAAQLED